LGWIALDKGQAEEALNRSLNMALEIQKNIAKRVLVFSTGTEVINGQIEDTNTPHITARLEKEGYAVTKGPTLQDDAGFIAAQIRQAVDKGFGLIITTGGVGAESKDCTVEALYQLDSHAAAPYICKFKQGTGRHAKAGVRIGAAVVQGTLVVALPGPNDEVQIGLEALLAGLKSGLDKAALADKIASSLIKKLKHSMKGHIHQAEPVR